MAAKRGLYNTSTSVEATCSTTIIISLQLELILVLECQKNLKTITMLRYYIGMVSLARIHLGGTLQKRCKKGKRRVAWKQTRAVWQKEEGDTKIKG